LIILRADVDFRFLFQELTMKNGRIDELEQRLAAANAELKASQEQSAAQINTIAAREKEFEVKKRDGPPSCF
jgi:hypothetical protein